MKSIINAGRKALSNARKGIDSGETSRSFTTWAGTGVAIGTGVYGVVQAFRGDWAGALTSGPIAAVAAVAVAGVNLLTKTGHAVDAGEVAEEASQRGLDVSEEDVRKAQSAILEKFLTEKVTVAGTTFRPQDDLAVQEALEGDNEEQLGKLLQEWRPDLAKKLGSKSEMLKMLS